MMVNKTKLLHEFNERFGKKITRGWVDSFVKCYSKQVFETKNILQENRRFEMSHTFLEVTITGFQDYVHNLCAELVFNLHEIVINEW
jgi:hypothetical protein